MTAGQSARPPWSDLVLVCGKCARKAGRKSFGKELKGALKRLGRKKSVRVVEVACLDLCPKRRLTVATPADLARRRLSVWPADCDAEAVAAGIEADHPPRTGPVLLLPSRSGHD